MVLIKAWGRLVSDRLASGDESRRNWSARLISDAQKRMGNDDSKVSLCVDAGVGTGIGRGEDEGGGDEHARLKIAVEGGGGGTSDEDDDEQVESVVFEREIVIESFRLLLATTAIVWIAESVSLSTGGGGMILFCCQILARGVLGGIGGGVGWDLTAVLSWLVIRS